MELAGKYHLQSLKFNSITTCHDPNKKNALLRHFVVADFFVWFLCPGPNVKRRATSNQFQDWFLVWLILEYV